MTLEIHNPDEISLSEERSKLEEEADVGHISEEKSFFEEFDLIFHHILPRLTHSRNDGLDECHNQIENGKNNSNYPQHYFRSEMDALTRFRAIIDKYLEYPTLLDPYLERMTCTLADAARTIVHQIFQHDLSEPTELHTQDACPDNYLPGEHWIPSLKRLLSAIYCLAKVRGRKQIQRYLSHEACDVEPVFYVLRCFQTDPRYQNLPNSSADPDVVPPNWESIFSLFLWLGILSLVPFGLNSIDSTLMILDRREHDPPQKPTLVSSILLTARQYLSDSGPTRETAAACLASLLSRPDLEELELQAFFQTSNQIMETYWRYLTNTGTSIVIEGIQTTSAHDDGKFIFLVMGVIHTMAIIFKTGSRSSLMDRHLRCVETTWKQAILLAEWASPKSPNGGGALLLRKLLVKFFARIGCAYLPPRLATWRYQRGNRSLLDNMSAVTDNYKKNLSDSVLEDNKEEGKQDDTGVFFVPDQVEDSMGQMIRSLSDPATTVRWSAAKGIGRLSERLPMLCVDDVLDAILVLCEDKDNDDAWHGSCLALAELARRGLLLPDRLAQVVPLVIFAMSYDIRRGQRSIGSHIRDAACYTCWAFARAYAPVVLSPYVPELSKIIVLTSLFDREINCRRAASACFQESVGRQGADNFKHGIEILTIADYFSLGNRADAFTSVSIKVAQYEEYRFAIVQHLCESKLFHWDVDIRTLSSKALHALTPLDSSMFQELILAKLIPKCTDPTNFSVRHGAVLGVAEIALTLGQNIPIHIAESIAEIVPNVEKARLYRGRGGDLMRSSISRLIECLSLSKINLTIKQQVRLLDSIDANLSHPSEVVQASSVAALSALMRSYFPVSSTGPSERLQTRVVTKYTDILEKEDNAAATRGYALAIGSLPSKLLAPNTSVLDRVINVLCHVAHPNSRVGDSGDAETRKNAIESLTLLCTTVGIEQTQSRVDYPTVTLNTRQVKTIFDSFLHGMNDYNTDRRGDVGSWVRIAAMHGVVNLIILAAGATYSQALSTSDDHDYINEEICHEVVGAILKQLSEKLDSVRFHAGSCLQKLLLQSNPILCIPHRETLKEAFLFDNESSYMRNWAQPSFTFPLLLKAINIEPYFFHIFSGLIISVGGLTESVTKSSTISVLDYFRALKKSGNFYQVRVVGNALLTLFQDHHGDGRVILPLLVTIDKLLSHGCLESLILDPSCTFAAILFDHVCIEASSCTDIKRLIIMVPVVIGLMHSADSTLVTTKIHPFLMKLLAHRYPRIRRHSAEQLYIKLVEDDCSDIFPKASNIEFAISLLSDFQWDMDSGSSDRIRETRNSVSDLLGIKLTEKERSLFSDKTSSKVKGTMQDEFESYASLINARDR